ncbi:MAG: hypothetical protein FVQ77_16930 [Cytophagales bacterium]|nr:hypothetical protein [Cytophagales bacterium]
MKKVTLTFTVAAFLTLGALGTFAQSPQAFKYQAIARDNTGNVLPNQNIGLKISILQTTPAGTVVYSETHTDTTNQFGLFSLEIGTGAIVSGTFSTIDWGADIYFVKIEMDETGGTTYQLMGTSQLLSVPYALHAKTAEIITETDPVFGSSVAGGITGADTANWNNHTIDTDTQLDSTGVAALGYAAGAHTVNTDTQLDSTGIANLGYVAGTISETDPVFGSSVAGGITGTDTTNWNNHTIDTDTQLDSTGVSSLGFVAGAHTIEVDADTTNELQTLSLSNDTLNISNGNSVILTDADSTNEIQLLSFSNDTLYLSNGGFVVFPYDPFPITSDDPSFTCGDKFLDWRDGKTYSTVLIGTQCWMAENLNVGAQIPPAGNQTNNAVIEKYCHGGVNSTSTEGDCSVWGGLYQWDEMMQYVTTPGTQGLCPTGWHIPTDAEWMTMEEALGMCSGGTNTCGGTFCSGELCWRGTDQGDQLKTAADCFGGVNCGISGFEALLAGYRDTDGLFYSSGTYSFMWSSTESGANAWFRFLFSGNAGVFRNPDVKLFGFSVRCLKD